MNYETRPQGYKTGVHSQTQIKRIDWLLACVHKQPIIALYFEFETVLKFYNLGARFLEPSKA